MSEKKKSIEGVHLKAGMQIPKRTNQVTNEVKSKEPEKKVNPKSKKN